MKKKFLLLIIGLFIFFFYSSFFQSGFPYTHDGENHLARFANYKVAVKEGQIPPRFAPNLMNHYGYPVFNYNYPLANIISLPFSFLKINYETTFKIITFLFLFIGGYGVIKYLSEIKELKSKTFSRLIASIVFLSTPYIFSLVLYRGNIGEIMAYSLFPWLLWMVENIKNNNKISFYKSKIFLFVIIWLMFFLSHNVSVLFGSVFIVLYAIKRFIKDLKSYAQLFITMILALLSSLWFWLPAYFEQGFTVISSSQNQQAYLSHFPTIKQLLFSPVEFGFSYPGSIDTLSFSIGLFGFFVLVMSIVLSIINWKQYQKIIITSIGFSLLTLVAQLPITAFIWEALPLVNFIQFPWRLTLFFSAFSLPLLVFVYQRLSKTFRIILILILIFWILNLYILNPVDRFHKTNVDYDAFSQSTTTQNENLPVGFNHEHIADWKPGPSFEDINIDKDNNSIDVIYWQGSKREYNLKLSQTTTIIEPTMYFPGWQTWVNGKKVMYDLKNGRIAYSLPSGSYSVKTRFTQQTWARIIGNAISLATFIGLSLYFIWIVIIKRKYLSDK